MDTATSDRTSILVPIALPNASHALTGHKIQGRDSRYLSQGRVPLYIVSTVRKRKREWERERECPRTNQPGIPISRLLLTFSFNVRRRDVMCSIVLM